jgi:hypothetical protein
MALADMAVVDQLAPAGLLFLERVHWNVSVPLPEGRSAASCLPEHGRFDSRPDEVADVEHPDMQAMVNDGWWRMATEYGLLDENRDFLLAVDYRDPGAVDPEPAWVRVRLAEQWDLAGSGTLALQSWFAAVFTNRFVPEFTMLSLDGKVLLNTTVWGNATVSTIAIRPDRATMPH